MNLFSKKGTKILHIADMHQRHQGRLFYSSGKKINNGFIKNNFNVLQISDRDFLKSNVFNYKKKYQTKSLAMRNEYLLKKNYKLRKKIKDEYLKS